MPQCQYLGKDHASHVLIGVTIAKVNRNIFYDATGKYSLPFAIAAALLFGCIIVALLTRPPRPKLETP
jgi:NADH:ubiquinone oxidoreductase subunit 6 (subunit J)